MLTQDVSCPYCSHNFQAIVWADGSCEKCSGNYYWSIEVNQDLSDSWHVIEWDHPRSIYIASTLSNWCRAKKFIDYLQKYKIPIAYDWTPFGKEIFCDKAPRDLNPASLSAKAINEYDGVSSASYILMITPDGRGTNFELGVAYQRLKTLNAPQITILSETQSDTPVSFHYLPGIKKMYCVYDVLKDVFVHFGIDIKNINAEHLKELEL